MVRATLEIWNQPQYVPSVFDLLELIPSLRLTVSHSFITLDTLLCLPMSSSWFLYLS